MRIFYIRYKNVNIFCFRSCMFLMKKIGNSLIVVSMNPVKLESKIDAPRNQVFRQKL